ncbi:DUF3160 domain-containing protein [bacterium]|nr:DUF3160 domain-containing protein [bacterium]
MLAINRILLCILLLAFVALASCGGGQNSQADPQLNGQQQDSQAAEPGITTPAPTETTENPGNATEDTVAPTIETGGEGSTGQPVEVNPAPSQPVEVPVDPPTKPAIGLDLIPSGFAAVYGEDSVRLPAAFGDPRLDLPIDLDLVANYHPDFFSAGQRTALSHNGFFVEPQTFVDHLDSLYSLLDENGACAFITSDALLHTYHLVFAKLLREMEEQHFYPMLVAMTDALTAEAQQLYADVEGTSLEEQALHLWAYFTVAQQLLSENPPAIAAPISDMVSQELARIEAHEGFAVSPVLTIDEQYNEDYSQYVPRSHYSRTELRRRYFKAMIWYGRMNLRLKSPVETQMALLITYLAQNTKAGDTPVTTLWAAIYDPTAFLVGNADDLGLREYSAVMADVFGEEVTLGQIADEALLAEFTAAAKALPPPQINSMFVLDGQDVVAETQGFRFMGQRFVLDSFLMGKLIHQDVSGRWLPSGLDVFACFGNDEAYTILDERGDPEYVNYVSQLAKMQDYVAGYTADDWTCTVYSGWLYSLEGLTQPKGDAYPPFMRTQTWARHELSSALGSWAQLRHDTILYAKQCYGTLTCEPPVPPPPYVEPDPLVFARLVALAAMTRSGLAEQDYLATEIEDLLLDLEEMLGHCQAAAEAELAGEALPEATAAALADFHIWLMKMTAATLDLGGGAGGELVEPEALVADVATSTTTNEVLEVGVGYPDYIYVIIPGAEGTLYLATGGVFSYYEFAWPINDRLTDEKWQELVEARSTPDRPAWTESFVIN